MALRATNPSSAVATRRPDDRESCGIISRVPLLLLLPPLLPLLLLL